MTALVSIIIPCYNAETWLAASVESALAQTWPRCEVILVDDGSTDGSLAQANTFVSRGVKVVSQRNAGASAARNHGLRLARGEYIQFLDADDLLGANKIAAQLSLLGTRAPGTVASCAWGRFFTTASDARFVDDAVFRDFGPLDFLVHAAHTGDMMQPAVWLTPRSLLDRAGPWDESLSLNDDGEYFARVLLASAGIAFCAEPGAAVYYRSAVSSSLSQRRSDRARRSQFRSIELMTQHLLAAEESPRTRQAAADWYQRFIHDFFPAPAELMVTAAERVAAFGGSDLVPPMGPRTAALARIVGWKNVWRLKYWLSS